MDLALNISTSASSIKPTQKLKFPTVGKKKKQNTGGFDFNFVKNDKVKAVVARRRPVQATVVKKSEAVKSTAANLASKPVEKAENISKSTQKNYVTPLKPTPKKPNDDVDALLNIAKVKKPEDEVSLSLNIDTNVDLSTFSGKRFGEKKKKLSRNERKERVMQRRIEEARGKQDNRTPYAGPKPSNTPHDESNVTQKTSIAVQGGNSSKNPFERKTDKPNKPFKKAENIFKNTPDIPVVGQRFVKPLNEIVFTGLPMSSIGLHPHLVKSLADLFGITELTSVQQRAVPVTLEGRDILVRSQTGSGKTLAYALPIVQQLQDIKPKISRTDGIYALVIVPTRELAIQTLEVFIKLLKPFTWIVPTYITGGEKRKSEKARLRKGVNILIGTPGRICDHLLHTESFKLDKVKNLVLDEADRLYECGYEKDVKVIVDALNKPPESKNPFKAAADDEVQEKPISNLQTSLLSATLSTAVHQLAGLALKNPLFIDTCDQKNIELPKTIPIAGDSQSVEAIEESLANENIVIPEKVTQKYILVPPKLRLVTLTGLIAKETSDEKKSSKILVFLATENLVDYHYDLMTETLTKKVVDSDDEDDDNDDDNMALPDGESDLEDDEGLLDKVRAKTKKKFKERPLLADVKFFKLHGSLTQHERSAIFKAFKEAKSGVLLTTDVTARGIDVPAVDLVVQFSSPHKLADYVHRVGRTARAGRSGNAILFLCPNEVEFIRTLESKRIRIAQDDYKTYLKGVQDNSELVTGTLEEMASELQRKFESLVADDKEIYEKACKAFVSWLRYISSFPKDLRHIFNVKNAHMGHYAKSLALREPPKSFTKEFSKPKAPLPQNRLTYTDRSTTKKSERVTDSKTVKQNGIKRPAPGLAKFVSKSISLSTSEFDSGLPPLKKRKK
ncbi:probable ATP-dependent RNA helicase CG8611 [Sitodiplosis mosellana]|uniref:probable ATP-dependent RNA helicase CG8611 n=1 Tax=Sitodiplosis mosellana TaxID=263140 RepID=UPI002443E93A|nr:probable ATP-dependent RNA helicase CG8611 [Sitodiplosis mosellana]